ncbi:MAG: FtsW/RodA/SpoVE family cell cycle protein [Bacteroidota bacterium]
MKLRRYIKGDRIIWMVILILLVISLLSVYSSTGSLAYQHREGNTFFYLFRQLKFILLGLLIIFFVHLVPYRVFSRVSGVVLYLAIPLLILTLVAGKNINEATRWLQIPGTGLTIQTSDFAKIALVMYLAKVLSVNQNNISNFKDVFGKVSMAIILICALILPANFSTAAILFATSFSLMFVGRIPVKYLALMVFTGLFALTVFVGGSLLLNQEGRIATWKNRIENYASGEGESYQADQAKVAIVQGGLFGKGPGNSTQRNLLPHPYSDFIYAIIIEEYGSLLGGVFVLALYLWLFFRAGMIIRRSRSTYGAFLAFGLSMGLVLQAFVNMAVAVGLVPVTGQTLPLVSMGGSSIFFTSMATGMILSVSWGTNELDSTQLDSSEVEDNGIDLTDTARDVQPADNRTEFEVNG